MSQTFLPNRRTTGPDRVKPRSDFSENKAYLVVVLGELQHFLDDGLVELAVLAVVLQGQTLHPALLVQVQQHLNDKKDRDLRPTSDNTEDQSLRAWASDLLLQLIFPVVDGDGVVVSVQAVNQSLKEPGETRGSEGRTIDSTGMITALEFTGSLVKRTITLLKAETGEPSPREQRGSKAEVLKKFFFVF